MEKIFELSKTLAAIGCYRTTIELDVDKLQDIRLLVIDYITQEGKVSMKGVTESPSFVVNIDGIAIRFVSRQVMLESKHDKKHYGVN